MGDINSGFLGGLLASSLSDGDNARELREVKEQLTTLNKRAEQETRDRQEREQQERYREQDNSYSDNALQMNSPNQVNSPKLFKEIYKVQEDTLENNRLLHLLLERQDNYNRKNKEKEMAEIIVAMYSMIQSLLVQNEIKEIKYEIHATNFCPPIIYKKEMKIPHNVEVYYTKFTDKTKTETQIIEQKIFAKIQEMTKEKIDTQEIHKKIESMVGTKIYQRSLPEIIDKIEEFKKEEERHAQYEKERQEEEKSLEKRIKELYQPNN